MPSLDEWQAATIVCAAIIAICGVPVALYQVAKLAVKGVRRMSQLLKRMSKFFEQVNGDESEGRPSMMELLQETQTASQQNAASLARFEEETRARLQRIEQGQADHLEQGHPPNLNGPMPGLRRRR